MFSCLAFYMHLTNSGFVNNNLNNVFPKGYNWKTDWNLLKSFILNGCIFKFIQSIGSCTFTRLNVGCNTKCRRPLILIQRL